MINSYNKTTHNILEKEIKLLYPKLTESKNVEL